MEKIHFYTSIVFVVMYITSCLSSTNPGPIVQDSVPEKVDSSRLMTLDGMPKKDSTHEDTAIVQPSMSESAKSVDVNKLVSFAETQIGVPYKYASADPSVGFDCSGFITYVFNHFGIEVPRSSINFTNVGKLVGVNEAKRGDLILFTGTDSADLNVGHMGIVVENNKKELKFIHATSGKANGVTITPLNDYYKSRFVKTIRVFPQNEEL